MLFKLFTYSCSGTKLFIFIVQIWASATSDITSFVWETESTSLCAFPESWLVMVITTALLLEMTKILKNVVP